MDLPYSDDHMDAVRDFTENPHSTVITDRHADAPGDWTLKLVEDIPGDILVPSSIFGTIRSYNAEIDYFGREDYGPQIGGRHPLGGSGDAGIEVLEDSIRFHVFDIDDDREADYECVVNANPSTDVFRKVQKRTRLQIKNIQEHDHRGGLSIYLNDPDG